MYGKADPADRDFAIGLALGYQWADGVHDGPTRERFIDAAVMHGLAPASADGSDRPGAAMTLAASILGVRCDDDAAEAFWLMVAPGVDVSHMSEWFFQGFIAGAAEVFSNAPGDEFGELQKLIRKPPGPSA